MVQACATYAIFVCMTLVASANLVNLRCFQPAGSLYLLTVCLKR